MLLEYNRANAAFQSISSRDLAVDEEEKLIRSYLPDFVKLHESGVIGDEQRLNWVEAGVAGAGGGLMRGVAGLAIFESTSAAGALITEAVNSFS